MDVFMDISMDASTDTCLDTELIVVVIRGDDHNNIWAPDLTDEQINALLDQRSAIAEELKE